MVFSSTEPVTPVKPPDYFEVTKPNYPPPAYDDPQTDDVTADVTSGQEAAPPYTEQASSITSNTTASPTHTSSPPGGKRSSPDLPPAYDLPQGQPASSQNPPSRQTRTLHRQNQGHSRSMDDLSQSQGHRVSYQPEGHTRSPRLDLQSQELPVLRHNQPRHSEPRVPVQTRRASPRLTSQPDVMSARDRRDLIRASSPSQIGLRLALSSGSGLDHVASGHVGEEERRETTV